MAEVYSEEWRANVSAGVRRAWDRGAYDGTRSGYGTPGLPGEVPVGPIRAAVLAEVRAGSTWSDLCRRMGWIEGRGRPQTSRLKRALGMMPTRASRRGRSGDIAVTVTTTARMRRQTAEHIVVFGLHRDPVEFGL